MLVVVVVVLVVVVEVVVAMVAVAMMEVLLAMVVLLVAAMVVVVIGNAIDHKAWGSLARALEELSREVVDELNAEFVVANPADMRQSFNQEEWMNALEKFNSMGAKCEEVAQEAKGLQALISLASGGKKRGKAAHSGSPGEEVQL